MANLSVSIPHQLGRAEAKQRVEELIDKLRQQYGSLGQIERSWEGDTLHFTLSASGMSQAGEAFVEDQAVRVEIPLPWPLAMLAGNLKKQIEQEGRKMLGGPPSQ
jgi:putative polyhydroxyalkanoate system protein